jgi:hypothetical protein
VRCAAEGNCDALRPAAAAIRPAIGSRYARNRFVHDGETTADAGCIKGQLPGIITTFLQACRHPDYS